MEYETSFDFCNVPIGVSFELDVYDRDRIRGAVHGELKRT